MARRKFVKFWFLKNRPPREVDSFAETPNRDKAIDLLSRRFPNLSRTEIDANIDYAIRLA